jgi:DNA-binding SARP family transcriptional activator
MDFRILGPVEVHSGGEQLRLGGPRQRALLTYLLLHANEVVAGERLLDDLWLEAPRGGLAALQTHVSRLRRVLGARIVTSGSGYAIRVEPGELDLERFRSLLAEAGAAADPTGRSQLLRDAEALWHGVPLAGLDVPFAAGEAAALEELRLAALEDRIEADLETGLDGELVSELSGLVRHHPLRERLRGQLILALYRSGRQADALEAYRETRQMLDEELGLEPTPALRELERAILRHDPALAGETATRAEPPSDQASPPRRRAPLAAVATLVALGALAVAAVALTSEGGSPRAQSTPTSPVRTVTRPVDRPALLATKHHARARTTTKRTHVAKHQVALTATTSSKVGSAPPTQRQTAPTSGQAAPTKTTPAATIKRKTKTDTTPTRKPTVPPPKPVTISDTFDADFVDPTIWHQVTTDANVSIAEQGGQLLLTVGAAAVRAGTYNQIDVHVGTQCTFPGNFDARVDFTLLEWPTADNILVGLNAIYAGSEVGRENSSQWGDGYASWVAPDSNGSIPLPDTSGSIRIARVNGIATTYVWHRGGWVRVAVGSSKGAAVFGLQASSSDGTSAFGGQELKVGFDNFTVTGANPICPPGSQPG